MKRITKLMLALALCVLGVGSVQARTSIDMSTATASENATWTSATNTFSWTAENEYIVIPGLSGDLTDCYLDFTISAPCHIDIVYNDNSKTEGGWGGYGRFGSGGSKSQDLGFMAGTKINDVKEVRLCSQSASGSLTVTNVSYYFPLKLRFDSKGVAKVPFNSIITSGGVTFDPSTGIVTNTDGTGYLALEIPASGIDLSTIKRIDVSYSGEENVWGGNADRVLADLQIPDVNTWQGSRYACDYTNYSAKSSNVKTIKWNAGGKIGGTLTISAISFTSEFISCAAAGETVLKTLPWNKTDGSGAETPDWNMNGTSDTYYGNYSGTPDHYADLTDYSELRVYCPSNTNGFRCFFINADQSGVNQIHTSAAVWNAEEKYYSLNLSSIIKWDGKIALKAIKQDNGDNPSGNNISNIVAYKMPAAGSAQYQLTGKGILDDASVNLLFNANVTSIDVTGMTNVTKVTLNSVNPNCLFVANANKLENTQNVIVSGTCANLVLTDGHPFKAPADFTATAASYTTTINTEANAGTLCLPFEANIPGGVEAYTLEYTGGDAVVATEIKTGVIPANTPVLLNGSGAKEFVSTNVPISASATNVNGALTGVFKKTPVPVDSYVLQDGASGVGFYKVASTAIYANPFRAYLTAQSSASRLSIVFADDEEVTGIQTVKTASADKKIFNLNGQRMNKLNKGLNIIGGKKVMIK